MLPAFIYKLSAKKNYNLLKTKKVSLSGREHKGQEGLSVSAVVTLPSNIAAPRSGSLQGKACCSCSGLSLIASTTESYASPAKGRVYVRMVQVETLKQIKAFYLVGIYWQ